MNLVVDIGNSFIKAAVVERDDVLKVSRFSSVEELQHSRIKEEFPQLQRAIVASTSIPTAGVAEILLGWGLCVLEMTAQTPVPIGNAYHTPSTLGVDRLAAAVGAVGTVGRDCLIVDFG